MQKTLTVFNDIELFLNHHTHLGLISTIKKLVEIYSKALSVFLRKLHCTYLQEAQSPHQLYIESKGKLQSTYVFFFNHPLIVLCIQTHNSVIHTLVGNSLSIHLRLVVPNWTKVFVLLQSLAVQSRKKVAFSTHEACFSTKYVSLLN